MPSKKTPEDRARILEKANRRAKKGYKLNIRTKRKFELEGEEELVKDMVVVLKLAHYSNNQIASIVGVSRGQVKIYLDDKKVQTKILALRERLPQAAINLMQAYLVEAVQWIVHIGRTSQDEALVLKAAAELMDRGGISKSSRTEVTSPSNPIDNINKHGHEVVFEMVSTLSDEAQEQAAQLYDAMVTGLKHIIVEEKGNSSEQTSDASE